MAAADSYRLIGGSKGSKNAANQDPTSVDDSAGRVEKVDSWLRDHTFSMAASLRNPTTTFCGNLCACDKLENNESRQNSGVSTMSRKAPGSCSWAAAARTNSTRERRQAQAKNLPARESGGTCR